MMELDIDDVVSKLWRLRSFSCDLSARMDHEEELPEDPVPYLVGRISSAYARCESATIADKAEAHDELAEWLSRSYRFYLCRLAKFDVPWVFTFPECEGLQLH